jgi:thioredoxin-related protein
MKEFKIYLFLCFLLSPILNQELFAEEPASGIHWISFEEAVKQNSAAPKKIFIDMYTHWCGWCKRMDATTFQDPAVTAYMNQHFYAVKFDAETRDSIFFKNQYFQYKPEYKANELAAVLMNGQMSYPTAVYLDSESNPIGPVPGYLTAEQFLPVLKYFGEDIYKTTKWDDYLREQFK